MLFGYIGIPEFSLLGYATFVLPAHLTRADHLLKQQSAKWKLRSYGAKRISPEKRTNMHIFILINTYRNYKNRTYLRKFLKESILTLIASTKSLLLKDPLPMKLSAARKE